MKQRVTAIVGSIFLFAGCLTSLCLIVEVTNAYVEGIFSTLVTDTPSNDFESFSCPLLLGRHEANQVSVSIANPTTDSLEYSVKIGADGLEVESPAREQMIVVPGNQTTTLVWTITAIKAGNQAIVIQALSGNDLTLPGPFHSWPTSFREGCGLLVIDTPLTGAQVMWLSGLSVFLGTALIFPSLSRKVRDRKARKNAKVA